MYHTPTINFLPWRERRDQWLRRIFVGMLCTMVVLGLGLVWVAHEIMNGAIDRQQKRNDYLQHHRGLLQERAVKVQQLAEQYRLQKHRVMQLDGLQKERLWATYWLAEIAKVVPEGVVYTRLEQSGRVIKLIGMADSKQHIAQWMRALHASPWFVDLSLLMVNRIYLTDRPMNEFELAVSIKPPEQAALNAYGALE